MCESNAWQNWHTFDSRHICWCVLCETSARARPTCSHTQNRPVKQYSKAEMYASLRCQVSCKSYVIIGKLRLSSQVSSLLGQVSSPLGMARVNKGSQFYLPCHPYVYSIRQVEWTIPSQPQSFIALLSVLISRPAEGRRLSWPGWLITYGDGIHVKRSPISVY